MARKIDVRTQAKMRQLLALGQHTCKELAVAVNVDYNSTLRFCNELREKRELYIHAWRADKRGAYVLKLYKLGDAPDAPRGRRPEDPVVPNTRTPWGAVIEQTAEALKACGPMHARELADIVPASDNEIRMALARMAQPSKRGPTKGKRRAHVVGWALDAEGSRNYPRPIYALGHGSNKPKPPKRPRNEVARQWERKVRKHQTHNFVFNLGL